MVIVLTRYQAELYHYGVLGMKWGVRRYNRHTDRANKRIAKVGTSKTLLGKATNNYLAKVRSSYAYRRKDLNDSHSTLSYVSNRWGNGRVASKAKANSEYHERAKDYSKTKYFKTTHDASAFNFKSLEKSSRKIQSAKTYIDWCRANEERRWNRPVKSYTGRTMTSGERAVERFITLAPTRSNPRRR